ncbi:hypothetical protein BRIN106911_24475 [Brevibacillus invocatus]
MSEKHSGGIINIKIYNERARESDGLNRYMDLKVDFAFKLLFGTEGNEPILRALLNAILNRETAVAFFCPNSLNNPVKTR